MNKVGWLLLLSLLLFGCLDFDRPNTILVDQNVSGVNDFNELNDTPANYVGSGSKCVAVNVAETGLDFIVCASGGASYTGVLPIDVNSDSNVISLDVNAYSNWIGLFDGFDSNEFVLWVDGNLNYVKQVDGNLWYIKVDDSNNTGRLVWSAINYVNIVMEAGQRVSVFDFNVGSGIIGHNDLNYSLLDLNHSVQSQCSGDANAILTSEGDCVSIQGFHVDTDIYTHGILGDSNEFKIDINAGEHSIFNAIDVNATSIFIQTTGDMNFFVYDTNVIIQTASGLIKFVPDQNKVCVGNDTSFCMWNSDGNGFIGWE